VVCAYIGALGYENAGVPGAWRVIGYFALYALAFAVLSWAMLKRRRWVRAPLIVLQLIFAASGLGFLRNGPAAVGVAMIALAVAGIALLLAPGTTATLGTRRG
jgi:hypothetical protein